MSLTLVRLKMKENKLHNIKSTGFKTPDHYFESFDNKLFDSLHSKKTIENIESSGFVMPINYLETVEASILSKLETEKTPVLYLQTKRTFYYVAGIAASFILFFSLIFNTDDGLSIDAIDTVAIESYLYQEDYTNDELASLFNSSEISETDFIDVNISDETLNQYLENIDTEDLILD